MVRLAERRYSELVRTGTLTHHRGEGVTPPPRRSTPCQATTRITDGGLAQTQTVQKAFRWACDRKTTIHAEIAGAHAGGLTSGPGRNPSSRSESWLEELNG